MKLLIVLMSLACSQILFAAEKCKSSDGKTMYCFTPEYGKKLLDVYDNKYPSSKRQIDLLTQQIKFQKKLEQFVEKQRKLEQEENKQWKENYKAMLKGLEDKRSEIEFKDDISTYTHIGMFVLGAVTGGGIMYGSSLLVSNTIQGDEK